MPHKQFWLSFHVLGDLLGGGSLGLNPEEVLDRLYQQLAGRPDRERSEALKNLESIIASLARLEARLREAEESHHV